MIVLFDRLPLGARFRYVDDPEPGREWVNLGRGDDQRGTIAQYGAHRALDWLGQGIVCLADTPAERARVKVKWLDAPADAQATFATDDRLGKFANDLQCAKFLAVDAETADLVLACLRDAMRYRWLRDGNAYAPEWEHVRGGGELDTLCDTKGERSR